MTVIVVGIRVHIALLFKHVRQGKPALGVDQLSFQTADLGLGVLTTSLGFTALRAVSSCSRPLFFKLGRVSLACMW